MRLAARTEPADGGREAQKNRYCTVWKLDRFGRSLRHLVNALAEFESLNIAFVSLSDNLDLSTASGRLMFKLVTGFRNCAISCGIGQKRRAKPFACNESTSRLWHIFCTFQRGQVGLSRPCVRKPFLSLPASQAHLDFILGANL